LEVKAQLGFIELLDVFAYFIDHVLLERFVSDHDDESLLIHIWSRSYCV
jgi:hypothetical protein